MAGIHPPQPHPRPITTLNHPFPSLLHTNLGRSPGRRNPSGTSPPNINQLDFAINRKGLPPPPSQNTKPTRSPPTTLFLHLVSSHILFSFFAWLGGLLHSTLGLFFFLHGHLLKPFSQHLAVSLRARGRWHPLLFL
ncbi:hypothetical protein IE53DRAFT_247792 [Violaceomyces palustris]|uniref:Uncharacterized protein n=1 Tax=Violaceomyces palustris TaxID=1673888 RepID=A0ACD0NNQ9_9BASI|nr:hypothetical protein IE53DRAFT_247792 [Violaceomyces palustris]